MKFSYITSLFFLPTNINVIYEIFFVDKTKLSMKKIS